MNWFNDLPASYLHRAPVDFHKAVNDLSELVEQELEMNPFDENLYVFCNRKRDRLKILHWDKTGFVLWYKRPEKEKFK
jgi:transposase